jgi:calcineurin-like phosphoesterase family protein
MMAYGMERAKQQMGQTLQAQRRRPAEGAMKAQPNQAADFNVDIRAYKPSERRKIYDLIHKGKMTWG